MAGMLAVSERELKTTVINMVKALMEKLDNIQEQKGNVSKNLEILRKNKDIRIKNKEMLGIKKTISEMKNIFDGPLVAGHS